MYKHWTTRAGLVLATVFVIVWSLFPIMWMFSSSFKSVGEIYSWPPTWIPREISWENYKQVFVERPFLSYVKNSTIVSLSSVLLSCGLATMAGYAFSKYKFKGRSLLFLFVLATRAVPPASLLLPFYIIGRKLGLINTRLILILAYIYITLPLNIWIIKGFFDTVPSELIEAAEVDGCTRLQALGRVVFPVIRPAVTAIVIITFITSWNELLYAVVFASTPASKTIPPGLTDFFGDFQILWGPLEAAASLATVPAIIFAIFFTRYIISGLVAGALKG